MIKKICDRMESNIYMKPHYLFMQSELDSTISLIYFSSMAEVNIYGRSALARSLLSLLRVRANKFEDADQIENIDLYIKQLNDEIKKLENLGDEATYDNLWKITNSILDYATEFVFEHNIIQITPCNFVVGEQKYIWNK